MSSDLLRIVIFGVLTGLTYAVLAAGLVLVYRSSRVINLAHGEIGAFGATLLAYLVINRHWPYALAFCLVIVVGTAVGALVELSVVRRLATGSKLILLVGTIGVSQLLFFGEFVVPGPQHAAAYPTTIDRVIHVGSTLISGEHFMVLAVVPAVLVGLTLFLNRTLFGVAMRASAENADAARLAGISTRRVSTATWALAGALATITAVLSNPLRGAIVGAPSAALGPGLLLRALVPALFAGFDSLPMTIGFAVLVGVAEQAFLVELHETTTLDISLFVLTLILLLVRRFGDDEGGLSISVGARALQRRAVQTARLPRWTRLPVIAGGAMLPLVFQEPSQVYVLTEVLAYAVIGLSVVVLTGWAGQLSLGQFAFAGIGAASVASLEQRGMPFLPALGWAVVAGVVAAVVMGLPALRIRGLFLAVTTLAFAVATYTWVLPRSIFLKDQTYFAIPRAALGPLDLHSQKTYYEVVLAITVLLFLGLTRLRTTGIGRSLVAVRDNEKRAAACGVHPAYVKLLGFALSGGVAALGGALLGGLRVQFDVSSFGPAESLSIVALAVIGGLESPAGALLGAGYVVGLPLLFGNGIEVKLLTSGAGLLFLLLYFPGGLHDILSRAGNALARALSRAPDAGALVPRFVVVEAEPWQPTARDEAVGLELRDIDVSFGGRKAVDGVSLVVHPGETVGLIGSNGAGKSTLMNVVSGFIPARGAVLLAGRDISELDPTGRARLGVARGFQDARLFGTLTVHEALMVAREARDRSEFLPSLLALPPARRAERAKRADAEELVAFFGLGRYAHTPLLSLSTGTRRICELACLMALEPAVLLLDEPTAGVAQREAEAFVPVISGVRRELNATMLVIEHDMPLVMGLSDRVYCMAAGQVIAEGTPDAVRHDPKVVAAYLGTDERAISRSGAVTRPRRRARAVPA